MKPFLEIAEEIETNILNGKLLPGDPLTLSVLFYSSIQGFAETLITRNNLKLPEKEWFLAILRKENEE